MLKKVLALSCVTFISMNCSAMQPTFSLALDFGGSLEEAFAATENQAGNFVVAGKTQVGGVLDVAVAELSPNGTVVNSVTVGGPDNELVQGMFQSADGNYILCGCVFTTTDYDWFVMKLDANLNLVWYRQFGTAGSDYANSCYEISPGHYLVTGTAALGGSAKPSVVVLDSSGAVLHEGYQTTNQFASPNYRGRYLGNGNIGYCNLANAVDIVDTNGAVISHCPSQFCTFTRDIAEDINGGYALTGVAGYGAPQGSSVAFGLVNSSLTTFSLMMRYYNNGNDLSPVTMLRGNWGDYFIAGTQMSFSTADETPFVLHVDPNGTLLGSYDLLPPGAATGSFGTFMKTSTQGYVAAGKAGLSGLEKFFVTLLDSSGGSCASAAFPVSTAALSTLSVTPHASYAGNISPVTPPVTAVVQAGNTLTTFCNVTAVTSIRNTASAVSVYPSVFTNEIHINTNVAGKVMHMQLFDASGKLALEKSFSGETVTDCSKLLPGAYLVKIYSREDLIYTGKLVKNVE